MKHPPRDPAYAAKVIAAIAAKDRRGNGRRPTQSTYDSLHQATTARLRKATRQLDGDESVANWQSNVEAVLHAAHESAARLGRMLSGDLADSSAMDSILARQRMATQLPRLHRFADNLRQKDPRYWDQETSAAKTDRIASRLSAYADVIRGTANEAMVRTGDADTLIDWVMLGIENHCGDCPDLQDGSPYTEVTLPTRPGDCDTECVFQCYCVLVVYKADDSVEPTIGFAKAGMDQPDGPLSDDDFERQLTQPLSEEELQNWFRV